MSAIEKVFENSINIVFASNDNYALPTLVAIYSLIANSSESNNYDIVVFESDISDINKNLIQNLSDGYNNVSIRFFNTKKFFEEFDYFHYSYISVDTYSRLFIPDVMSAYDKVVYLDSDVIINTDIAELYNIDLDNNAIAGNRNYILITSYRKKPEFQNYYDNKLGINNIATCINAGVLVMDLNKLRKIDLFGCGLELLKKYKALLYADEDIINKVCQGKIKYLSSSWNWRYLIDNALIFDHHLLSFAQEWAQGLYSQKIIHYLSKEKPWNEPRVYYGEIWWDWAKKTPVYQTLLRKYFDEHPECLQ